jgi:Metallo-peptidase family M12B Reprolysin-like
MFSVSHYDCSTGYFSFGHEIGHNLGMYHDRGTESSCSETTTFNYGYRDPSAAFRTILSYDCKMSQCDAMPKNGCTRIQRFSSSNPAYTYNGKAIGDSRRDNAKQANNVRASVAAFFPSMNCQSNTECNDNNPSTSDTCTTATRVCVFTPITSVPVKPPTKAPTRSPTKAPTRAPSQTNLPTKTPVQTNKPTGMPSMKPIELQPPVAIVVAPTLPPTNTPTRQPTKTPTRKPTRAPTRAPLRPPTKAPILPQTFFMESLKITGVTSTAWKIVTLSKLYVSPIPVCTVMYDQGTSLRPAVVRMQKVGATSFEIRLQNPSELALTGRDVHCVVVEEGKWKLPDGRLIESKKYSSTVTDRKGSYTGQAQTYQSKYISPVVLGQVMSYNDPKWSVFWSRSSSGPDVAPTTTSIVTGKHVGEDSRTARLAETVGFIVIESGHLKSSNIEIETGRGPDSFIGYTGKKVALKFNSKFGTTPVVAVLSQAAMDDSDGSWAVLTSNPSTSSVGISVDEDQLANTERSHSTEEVHYAVFSSIGAILLTKV